MTQDVRDLIAEARGSFKATNASANLIHRLTTAIEELLGERDAEVAAIERVRTIHRSEPTNGYNGQVRYECHACGITSPCPTIRALDGAPEPEEKP